MQWAAIAGAVVILVLAFAKLYKAFNSSAGERYLKQRMQGPFVPVEQDRPLTTAPTPESSSSKGAV